MCFSASASFGASGLLTIGGILFQKSNLIKPRNLLISSIPFIFAVHQFSEGLVWTGISQNLSGGYFFYATWFYIVISHLFWPVYMPIAMIVYNQGSSYQKTNKLLLLFGVLLASYIFYWMMIYPEIVPKIGNNGRSIEYYFHVPFLKITELLYLIIVAAPFFLTNDKYLRMIVGPAWALTFIVAKIISGVNTFPSVWCFLAAFVSLVIYLALKKSEEKINTTNLIQTHS